MPRQPKEFCEAMVELVERSQENPATAVSSLAYDGKRRILDFFVRRDPTPELFEKMLLDRISDADPEKELSRWICCQILNSWQSGSCHYTPEGKLVLRALYPADPPRTFDDGDELED